MSGCRMKGDGRERLPEGMFVPTEKGQPFRIIYEHYIIARDEVGTGRNYHGLDDGFSFTTSNQQKDFFIWCSFIMSKWFVSPPSSLPPAFSSDLTLGYIFATFRPYQRFRNAATGFSIRIPRSGTRLVVIFLFPPDPRTLWITLTGVD